MSIELKGMWKETSVSNVMYNSWICPEGLRKIKTPSQDNFQVQVRAGNFQSVWGTSNPKAFAFDIQRVGSASAIQLHRMYNIFPPHPVPDQAGTSFTPSVARSVWYVRVPTIFSRSLHRVDGNFNTCRNVGSLVPKVDPMWLSKFPREPTCPALFSYEVYVKAPKYFATGCH